MSGPAKSSAGNLQTLDRNVHRRGSQPGEENPVNPRGSHGLDVPLHTHDPDTQLTLHYAHPPDYSEVLQQPVYSEDFTPPLAQLSTMQISDPIPYPDAPIPRRENTLSRNEAFSQRSQIGNDVQQAIVNDSAYAPTTDGDTTSLSSDTSVDLASSNGFPIIPPQPHGYNAFDASGSHPLFPQSSLQPWQNHPPNFGPVLQQNVSQPGQYNLHAVASSVLGMGPVIGESVPHPTFGSTPSHRSDSLSEDQSALSFRGPSSVYQRRPSPITWDSPDTLAPTFDIESRPSLQRSGTTASVMLRTQKTKAVDLTAPPFTKEYIDQYRHRIKADPDPEAHFLYAKYLIDAAKKVGSDARDQRAVKKYRDLLIAESLKVIRRLATQGQAYDEAQFFLANCYGTGMLGLQVDHERAYHLYLQAAKQNHPAACYRVAVCNEIGAGTRREPPRAAAFYRKAASLGDTAAMYKLGMILLHGSLGEQKNPREAINWLKRAAEQADEENPHALHELGLLHEMPNSDLVVHDPAYARNLFTQAAHFGYTQSQYKLGQCHEYGALTCPADPRRSIAWYTKAAEKGNAEAELALSGWYLTGSDGVLKQSDSEAYLWARRAANKGLSSAEYAVGYYAETGIGIKQDIEFAKRWYMRAAAQGNKRAMNRLTEMKRMGNKRVNVVRPTRQQAKDECTIS